MPRIYQTQNKIAKLQNEKGYRKTKIKTKAMLAY